MTLMRAITLGVVALFVGLLLSVGTGPGGFEISWKMVWELRVPRALLAIGVGAGLSIAGVILQALFSNPLCEPYTLGVSSGAAFGAVAGGALGVSWSVGGLAGSAFLGAIIFAGILYALATRFKNQGQGILLSGVMLGFLGSSLVSLVMALSAGQGVQSALYWLLGDLSRARFESAGLALVMAAVSVVGLMSMHRSIDTLLLGEEGALSLGTDVPRLRARLLLFSSAIVAVCVSAAGMIGFIGLMVPHGARAALGSKHRGVIPCAAVWGAAALVWSDLLAKSLLQPNEVPVGVVTSLVGAPIFLWMILRKTGSA